MSFFQIHANFPFSILVQTWKDPPLTSFQHLQFKLSKMNIQKTLQSAWEAKYSSHAGCCCFINEGHVLASDPQNIYWDSAQDSLLY